jgi:hypothetical protein
VQYRKMLLTLADSKDFEAAQAAQDQFLEALRAQTLLNSRLSAPLENLFKLVPALSTVLAGLSAARPSLNGPQLRQVEKEFDLNFGLFYALVQRIAAPWAPGFAAQLSPLAELLMSKTTAAV